MSNTKQMHFQVCDVHPGVAYLTLPDHPGRGVYGCVDRTVELRDIIGDYKGPDVNLDFDKEGVLIGIEILP